MDPNSWMTHNSVSITVVSCKTCIAPIPLLTFPFYTKRTCNNAFLCSWQVQKLMIWGIVTERGFIKIEILLCRTPNNRYFTVPSNFEIMFYHLIETKTISVSVYLQDEFFIFTRSGDYLRRFRVKLPMVFGQPLK